ncbi:hypothetical protein ACBY01_07085 [Sphingomonas sp. ac-8]|uniref:hypothetical protein n=1 Tax=Sphingomonas sp. ac-8 TaxID=3242977 RepID=UPI003A7FAA65
MPALDRPYANFPPDKIVQAEELVRAGYSMREICRRVGTHHHNIRPILARLDAAGEVPPNCACGQARGHRGDCTVSTAARRGYPKQRVHGLSWPAIHDIRRRVDQGHSDRRIARDTGRSITAVRRHRQLWLAERDTPLPPCKCGRPARHPGGCIKNSPSLLSRDRRSRIERWAREGLSAAEMQRRSRVVVEGSGMQAILKYARPIWHQMAAEGIVCDCGQQLGHPATCSATWDSDGRVRGPQPIPASAAHRISNALLNGDSILTIRRAVEVSELKVLRVLRSMPIEDRHHRAVLVRRRVGEEGERKHGEDLFARIKAALPSGLDASLRDEVVAELSLAVLQGDLTLDQIAFRASRFIDHAYRTWADAYGSRSLNESLGDDGDAELLDLFGDDSAVLSLDDIEIGDGA